ncbi:MAG: hypothetical protein AAF348_07565 [Bacteroidota bacterium]
MKNLVIIFILLATKICTAQINDSITVSFSDNTYQIAKTVLYPYIEPELKLVQLQIVAPTLYLIQIFIDDRKAKGIISEPTFKEFYDWTQEYFKEELKY